MLIKGVGQCWSYKRRLGNALLLEKKEEEGILIGLGMIKWGVTIVSKLLKRV